MLKGIKLRTAIDINSTTKTQKAQAQSKRQAKSAKGQASAECIQERTSKCRMYSVYKKEQARKDKTRTSTIKKGSTSKK